MAWRLKGEWGMAHKWQLWILHLAPGQHELNALNGCANHTVLSEGATCTTGAITLAQEWERAL